MAPSCDAFQANLLTARIPEGVSAQKAANLPHVSSCLGTSDVKPRYVMLKSIELMMFEEDDVDVRINYSQRFSSCFSLIK